MEFDITKLAYCGLYCSQCSFVVAYETDNREHLLNMPQNYDKFKQLELSEYGICPGCKGENLCGNCKIKDCAVEKGFDCCADCNNFPCEIILSFANDGTPHHGEAYKNLNRIKALGKENWFEEYKINLSCSCGERLSWYYKCPKHHDDFAIRFATDNDTPLILGFIKELAEYEKMSDDVVATEELLREWIFEKQKAEVLIGEFHGDAVGFALFFYNFSTFLGRAGIYLEDLYIKPSMRGKGFGKRLLKHLAKLTVERGLR